MMRDNVVYNRPDNEVMVSSNGDEIHIICNELQMDRVVANMTTEYCKLTGYEEWDDDSDKKFILTFLISDTPEQLKEMELN